MHPSDERRRPGRPCVRPDVVGIQAKIVLFTVGHNQRGAIVLRQKWSRGQVETRLARRSVSGHRRRGRVLLDEVAASARPRTLAGSSPAWSEPSEPSEVSPISANLCEASATRGALPCALGSFRYVGGKFKTGCAAAIANREF